MTIDRPARIHFGEFTLDLETGEFARGGSPVPLQRKSFQVLAALLERPGELVSRDELRRALWPADVVVEFDDNLNTAVNRLRRAMGDSADVPRFIETLPGRGYRFLVPVAAVERRAAEAAQPAGTEPRTKRRRGWHRLARAVAAAAIVVLVVLQSADRPVHVAVLTFENVSGDPAQDHIGRAIAGQLRARFGGALSNVSVLVPGEHSEGDTFARARELRADYIVSGSVNQSADGLHVTALLLDARSHRRLWGGTFTCPRNDRMAIETQLATKITSLVSYELPNTGMR